jgi:23S rRNA (cytosine1962-C5)-methyltransferase
MTDDRRRPERRGPGRPPASSHSGRPRPGVPMVRRGSVRLPGDVAARVRAGHPWIYREALGGRPLRERTGDVIELLDPNGDFVARGFYEEDAIIAIRIMSRDEREHPGPQLAARRVREALQLRTRYMRGGHTAYRLVNGESDGLPGIAVDRYGDYLVVHLFTPAVFGLRDAVVDELFAAVSPRAIYEQRRTRTLAGEAPRPADLVRGAAAPVEVEVSEGPLKFWVDVTAPLSTGLFLDLRVGRQVIGAWSSGRRVLNLFSYTGAISVYAQQGGAREVVAVDVAAKAHARARRNFALNGFDPEKPEHIVGDVFKVLARMKERGRKFDLVVLDPPAFGTAGRGQVFSAVQDYRDLVAASLGVLVPGGLLAAASSTHKISHEAFDGMLAEGGARAQTPLRILERAWLPPDFCVSPGFPEGSYLKFALTARD